MDSELEKLHHGSTSSESEVNSPVITTPVLFQTIHLDVHENERWFPIIGWGTSRLANDLPNFTPVMFTHILDGSTAPEEETEKQSFAETHPSHQHSILAPSVAAFHRAFQESLMQNAMHSVGNIHDNNKSINNTLTKEYRQMCASMPIRPLHIILPNGYAWNGFWEVVKTHDKGTDSAGWRYASDFITSPREKVLHLPTQQHEQEQQQEEEEELQQEEEEMSDIHARRDRHDNNYNTAHHEKNITTETKHEALEPELSVDEQHRANVGSTSRTSNQHCDNDDDDDDDVQKKNQSKATFQTLSRARFKKTQTPICVVRYRTWRRQVKVVIAPHKQIENNTTKEVGSNLNENKPNENLNIRLDVKFDALSHAEQQDMPSEATKAATTITQSQESELLPSALSNLTLDEYELTEEDEINELYLQQKEAEMLLAESLKQRRLQILSNGQEWTQEMDLAAEEELRNFIRENRAKAQHESASSHRRSANRSFANPFFHKFAADNVEASANAHLQHTSAHHANHGNANSITTINNNSNSINYIRDNSVINNMNIHFGSQSGDAKELDILHNYNTCPEFGENAEHKMNREASHAEWVMEMQLKDSFTRSAEEHSPFTRNEHQNNSSPYLHPTFSPIENNDLTNHNNNNNNSNNKNINNTNDGNGHVLEFRSHSVLPNRVDGEDTQVIVNKFVAASPHEYDSNTNDKNDDGNGSDTSRSSNEFTENYEHSSNSVLVDGGYDFNAIFQKFVSNPETRHE